ncbi:hypothetical protein PAEPH01_1018 [Pancytospora epiphaga]|nr:hypothetical protein PAEPH01_1018 [Pancytospora epiphaga]
MSYHKQYSKEIGLTDSIKAYIQTIVLKKTLESISYTTDVDPPRGKMQRKRSLQDWMLAK